MKQAGELSDMHRFELLRAGAVITSIVIAVPYGMICSVSLLIPAIVLSSRFFISLEVFLYFEGSIP